MHKAHKNKKKIIKIKTEASLPESSLHVKPYNKKGSHTGFFYS
jgi:hypothetical protein